MIDSQIKELQTEIAECLAKIEGLSKNTDIHTPLCEIVDSIFDCATELKGAYSRLQALANYKMCKDLAGGKVVENIFETRKA